MDLRIFPPEDLLQATVKLPLSKSVANRALVIAALTEGGIAPDRLPDCDDTRVFIEALSRREGRVDCHGCGTALRFLTAFFAATEGADVIIDGNERLRQRPIAVLVEALRDCGADIEYAEAERFAPLRIRGRRLNGGEIDLDPQMSSQFASALLMVAPTMTSPLRLRLVGEIASEPYIRLTTAMMEAAGAIVDRENMVMVVDHGQEVPREGASITVEHGRYKPFRQEAEADWSAAAFWYEIEALTSGFLSLDTLSADSKQPDSAAARLFADLGVVTDFEGEEGFTDLCGSPDLSPRLRHDFSPTPDLVPAAVVTCVMLRIPFRFTGISTLRYKESDRIAALIEELARVGAVIESNADSMSWEGALQPVAELPVFDPHGDHRLAMSLAPVACYIPGIIVRDAEVVDKSYPSFWDDLAAAGFRVEPVETGEA